jgi:hypothetical protein
VQLLPILPILAVLGSAGGDTGVRVERHPVVVELTGDDGLTQKLSDALRKALGTHPRLRVAAATDQRVVTIESDTNVGWDKLDGRAVLIYTIYVHSAEERGEPVTGVCFESAMTKCVKDILRLTAIEADSLGRGR